MGHGHGEGEGGAQSMERKGRELREGHYGM